MIQRGFGDRAHQADRTAAIDEADIVLGKDLSERDGSFDKAGVGAGAGAAIDADGFDLVHALHVALQRRKLKSGDVRGRSRNRPEIRPNAGKIYLSRLYGSVKRSI